jgi:uncharacterized Ntn-hydrolase superfamily protein
MESIGTYDRFMGSIFTVNNVTMEIHGLNMGKSMDSINEHKRICEIWDNHLQSSIHTFTYSSRMNGIMFFYTWNYMDINRWVHRPTASNCYQASQILGTVIRVRGLIWLRGAMF